MSERTVPSKSISRCEIFEAFFSIIHGTDLDANSLVICGWFHRILISAMQTLVNGIGKDMVENNTSFRKCESSFQSSWATRLTLISVGIGVGFLKNGRTGNNNCIASAGVGGSEFSMSGSVSDIHHHVFLWAQGEGDNASHCVSRGIRVRVV